MKSALHEQMLKGMCNLMGLVWEKSYAVSLYFSVSLPLSVCLSLCLSVCLCSVSLSVCVCLSVSRSVSLSLSLSSLFSLTPLSLSLSHSLCLSLYFFQSDIAPPLHSFPSTIPDTKSMLISRLQKPQFTLKIDPTVCQKKKSWTWKVSW